MTEALREAYPDKTDLTAEQVDTTTIRLPLLKIMTHKADQNGAQVYEYLFAYGNSYHGSEIPYVFDLADGSDEERETAKQISQAWINFTKTGVPGAEGMPEWEPYTVLKNGRQKLGGMFGLFYWRLLSFGYIRFILEG